MRKLIAHIAVGLLLTAASVAQAATETVIHRFAGGGHDGSGPQGKLGIDSAGAIYGATQGGGLQKCHAAGHGCGVIFKLVPPAKATGAWAEKLFYKFNGQYDGYNPTAGVLVDGAGRVYGSAQSLRGGVVYTLEPTNIPTLPVLFTSLVDGFIPSGLTFGPNGIYGTATSASTGQGVVLVFPLLNGGPPIAYQSFEGTSDGVPTGSVAVVDNNIFGTTPAGGRPTGSVFELAAPKSGFVRRKSIVYSFPGGAAGATPVTGLISDAAGNLYGATSGGGAAGTGVIFKLSAPKAPAKVWTETVLCSFSNDGYQQGDLIFVNGALYGTTGGDAKHNGLGEVFRLAPPAAGQSGWRYTVLHKFTGGQDGALPRGGLVAGAKGALYGTTVSGGGGSCSNNSVKGCGTVFKVTP